MKSRADKLLAYLDSWKTCMRDDYDEIFDKNVFYHTYGEDYEGIEALKEWFDTFHEHGRIISWTEVKTYECVNTVILEWTIECLIKGSPKNFEGILIAHFNHDDKIKKLRSYFTQLN